MIKVRILVALFLILTSIILLTPSAEAGVSIKVNSVPGDADNNDPGSVVRSVDFVATEIVTDVNVKINWHAIDGLDCQAPGAGDSFADQVAFWLVSPMGTTVHLIHNDLTGTPTYTQSPAPRVETMFDDQATFQVGEINNGLPVSGTFRPEEPLSAFNGENMSGTWELHFQDSTEMDAVCYFFMELIIQHSPAVPTDTPVPPTDTPIPPTDTPVPLESLVVSADCLDENLAVTISAGDGPFDITASAGINTPVNGVSVGTTTINGPEKWDNLTVTETSGDIESVNLGQFKCRTDERPVPVSPAHRTRTTDAFPTFAWVGISGTNNYRIFVFDDKVAVNRTVDIRQNSGGPTTMQLSTPLPDGRLFWRVRGRQNRVWSLWSVRFTLFKDPTVP